MKKTALVAAVALAMAAAFVACGGDDDGDNGDGTPAASATARTAGGGSPAASGTDAAGTPGSAPTIDPLGTRDPSEQTAIADPVFGGSPDDTPVVISTIPAVTPIAGTTPVIDPTEVAPPDPQPSDLRAMVDVDASKPGIQTSREVNPGDTFRVAIVYANVGEATGGLSATQFVLNYDRVKIVAPSVSGGDSTERNPDLNTHGLGGTAAAWDCMPAPEGDLDDPGGVNGDGDPNTGQAYLSCFTVGTPNMMGDLVIGVITFHAVAPGQTTLSLHDLIAANGIAIAWAACEGDPGNEDTPRIPCDSATITVR